MPDKRLVCPVAGVKICRYHTVGSCGFLPAETRSYYCRIYHEGRWATAMLRRLLLDIMPLSGLIKSSLHISLAKMLPE